MSNELDNKSLVTMAKMYNAIELDIIENGGELTPAIEQFMSQLDLETSEKIDAYQFVMKKALVNAEGLRKMAEMYLNAAKALENVESNLKFNIRLHMKERGITEVSGNNASFKLVRSKPKVVINESELEDSYCYLETVKKVDKERIENELRQGYMVKGAMLEDVYALKTTVNKGMK